MTYPERILLVSSNIVQVFINFAKKQRDMLDHEVEESADLGVDSEEPDEEYDDDNLSYLNQGRCFKVNVYMDTPKFDPPKLFYGIEIEQHSIFMLY